MEKLDTILSSLDEKAIQTLEEIALSISKNKQSGWTGATTWTFHYSQGGIGDAVEETRRSLFRGNAKTR